jgi:hypothetical protein
MKRLLVRFLRPWLHRGPSRSTALRTDRVSGVTEPATFATLSEDEKLEVLVELTERGYYRWALSLLLVWPDASLETVERMPRIANPFRSPFRPLGA